MWQKWSCKWGVVEDAQLLYGIHKHGMGAWEHIKNDSDVGVCECFLCFFSGIKTELLCVLGLCFVLGGATGFHNRSAMFFLCQVGVCVLFS